MPLSFILQNTASNVIFSLKEFGILTPIVQDLFKDRICIQTSAATVSKTTIDLIGMNPNCVAIDRFQFSGLKTLICKNLDITPAKKPNKILLIERIAPDDYYLKDAVKKGAGSSRRSIINHEELARTLRLAAKGTYEFHNIKLETMSFADQIKLFDAAAVVIGQHGAGLSNILWMPKKSVVVEFGYRALDHFKKLSASMEHNTSYLIIRTSISISIAQNFLNS